MSAIFAVAGKLVTLFIYVLVGYVVSKRKMISEGFSAGISRFLLVVTIPCLILSTFETDYTFERLVKAGEVYVISLIIFGASILIGYLTAWIFRISEESKSVYVADDPCGAGTVAADVGIQANAPQLFVP